MRFRFRRQGSMEILFGANFLETNAPQKGAVFGSRTFRNSLIGWIDWGALHLRQKPSMHGGFFFFRRAYPNGAVEVPSGHGKEAGSS